MSVGKPWFAIVGLPAIQFDSIEEYYITESLLTYFKVWTLYDLIVFHFLSPQRKKGLVFILSVRVCEKEIENVPNLNRPSTTRIYHYVYKHTYALYIYT